jgi:uncharacterized membrane protein YqaE (UPF0057 family)
MTDGDRLRVGALIAAILLPPLGVWLVRGIGPAFWVSLVLTILAWVPGVVFAVVVVLVPTLLPDRRGQF